MTILDEIIAGRRKELAELAQIVTIGDLERKILYSRETISLSGSICDRSRTGIIAEFKRSSPSKGPINQDASAPFVASGYFREGASGISVLTENRYFGGSSSDLTLARESGTFPLLRKDFIFDEYQVVEAKAIGADAVLLIAAALREDEVLKLARLAKSLGLEVLLEVHQPGELDKINQYVDIIGVNNRNLKTFKVDTGISEIMADRIPEGMLKISESGISSPDIIKRLRKAGYDGFLIGEKFMATPDPVKTFAEFVKDLDQYNDKS